MEIGIAGDDIARRGGITYKMGPQLGRGAAGSIPRCVCFLVGEYLCAQPGYGLWCAHSIANLHPIYISVLLRGSNRFRELVKKLALTFSCFFSQVMLSSDVFPPTMASET